MREYKRNQRMCLSLLKGTYTVITFLIQVPYLRTYKYYNNSYKYYYINVSICTVLTYVHNIIQLLHYSYNIFDISIVQYLRITVMILVLSYVANNKQSVLQSYATRNFVQLQTQHILAQYRCVIMHIIILERMYLHFTLVREKPGDRLHPPWSMVKEILIIIPYTRNKS